MQKNIKIVNLFKTLKILANRVWADGIVTGEISDIFDMLFSMLMDIDKDHKSYMEWMTSRTGTTRIDGVNSFYDTCFKHIVIPKGAYILDVGTRRGVGLKLLSDRGYKNIRGIEICERTAKECKDFPIDIGDIHNSTYKPHTFDLVIIRGTLEHCYDPEQVLKELYKILKPDGCVFIGFPTGIAFAWGNCRKITLEMFFKWTHDIGFISHWIEGTEKRDTNNPIYYGSMIGILKK